MNKEEEEEEFPHLILLGFLRAMVPVEMDLVYFLLSRLQIPQNLLQPMILLHPFLH